MNDDRDFDLLMDQWLAGGSTEATGRLKDEAMARVVITPQAHGSPFTGRFFKMTAFAGLAAALVLAVSGVGLYLAVDDDPTVELVPAAATELDPAEVVARVSGDFGLSHREGADEILTTDYAYENRGGIGTGRVAADDPRLEGELHMAWSSDDFRPGLGGPSTASVAVHIENGDGTWDGVLQGFAYEQGMQAPGWLHGLLAGGGGYAGQSVYIIGDTSDEWLIPFHGLIFPGDMPEVP
jgi:hypothetical protein